MPDRAEVVRYVFADNEEDLTRHAAGRGYLAPHSARVIARRWPGAAVYRVTTTYEKVEPDDT